jgi:CubicO group peptidase (beta-lactamase class C family)
MIKKLATIIVLMFLSTLAAAQSFEAKIDSLVATVVKDKNGPGAVFMVAKGGKPIYQKAYGKSNLELATDMTLENVFQLGSMTKQFTAIAILMLQERGQLDLNSSIATYIPDYPAGEKITLHHLLTHTTGIKDFTKMKSIQTIAQKELSPKQVIDFFKNEPVDFAPGEKFEYNNSGYVILGHIIELVSGKTYEKFIQENIFEKVGMTHSRYADDFNLVDQRAYGYHQKAGSYVNKTRISFTIPFSSGALMSTLDDMLKWQNALNKNSLLHANTLKKAFTKYKLNSGEPFTYGYGWHLKEINGTPIREHGGSVFGFKTMGVYIPSKDIYVIGLSNCDCISPTQVTRDIAALALEILVKSKL